MSIFGQMQATPTESDFILGLTESCLKRGLLIYLLDTKDLQGRFGQKWLQGLG